MPDFAEQEWAESLRRVHLTPARTVVAFWLVLTALVLGGMAYLSWWPTLQGIDAKAQQVNEGLQRLKQQVKLLESQPQVEKELVHYRALLPQLQSALPKDKEVPDLLRQVYAEIERQDMRLLEFTPQALKTTEVLSMVPVTLDVDGDPRSIARLPLVVAALTRKVMLNEFDMTIDTKSESWKLRGSLVAFAQLPQSSVAGTELNNVALQEVKP